MTARYSLLAASLVLLLAPGAAPAAAPSCASGDTVYKRGAVRIVKFGRGNDDYWYGCRSRTARPVEIYVADGGLANFGVEARKGHKLVFTAVVFGENGTAHQTVGWFDTRNGRARSGSLADDDEGELVDVVVGKDGGIALAARTTADDRPVQTHVGYLPVARRRNELSGERRLASTGEGYVKGSLALGRRALTWRSASDPQRMVPLTGESRICSAGTTLLALDGVRLFEVLEPRRYRAVLLGCAAGATAPVVVASQDIVQLWRVRGFPQVGNRVPFRASDDGIGLLDGASGQFRFGKLGALSDLPRVIGTPEVLEITTADAAPVAFGARTSDGQSYIGTVAPSSAGSRFNPQRRLATISGKFVAGSLAVRDGRVHWRDALGGRNVSFDGEVDVTCASGTTLAVRDGIRIFETLDPAAKKARLFGCQPGSGAPVALTTAATDTSWEATLLAVENGRALVWARELAGDHVNEIVTFAPGADTARRGFVHGAGYPKFVLDSVAAADGSAAIAYKVGRKVMFTHLALDADPARLKRERRLKTVTDGFQPDSLALGEGEVTWRNAGGEPRSVPL